METKSEKFRRLAEKRVNVVLKQLNLIGNLSNKNNYEYSTSEVSKIVNIIRKASNNMETKYEIAKKERFKL